MILEARHDAKRNSKDDKEALVCEPCWSTNGWLMCLNVMGVSKNRGKKPKMDDLYGNPYSNGCFGGYHHFQKHPYVQH